MLKWITAALLLLSAQPALAQVEVIDRIVARVNDEIITLSELHRYAALLYVGQPEKPSGEDFLRQTLQQLIEKKLIEQQAQGLGIAIRDRDVDEAVLEIAQRNGITLEQLGAYLTGEQATLEEYRRLIRSELLNSEVVGRQVQGKITITDQQVQQYYDTVLSPRERPGARVRIQQILLAVPPDSTPEQRAGIERAASDIRQKIIGGEDFARMAFQYCQGPAAQAGGDMGYFYRGEMLPAIEQVAFSLEVGAISPVIATSAGLHIIKVIARELTDEDRTWQSRAPEIRTILYGQAFEKGFSEWLEGIRARAHIEVLY
jgi:peptidyl-prolyl cis-trans isomerase SurA